MPGAMATLSVVEFFGRLLEPPVSSVTDDFCSCMADVLAHWSSAVNSGDAVAVRDLHLPASKISILTAGQTNEEKAEGEGISGMLVSRYRRE